MTPEAWSGLAVAALALPSAILLAVGYLRTRHRRLLLGSAALLVFAAKGVAVAVTESVANGLPELTELAADAAALVLLLLAFAVPGRSVGHDQ